MAAYNVLYIKVYYLLEFTTMGFSCFYHYQVRIYGVEVQSDRCVCACCYGYRACGTGYVLNM